MRLIDADAFNVIGLDAKSEEFIKGAEYILGMIDRQPTAYDVEKVVEQIEENAITDALAISYLANAKIAFVSKRMALEIIESGGVE